VGEQVGEDVEVVHGRVQQQRVGDLMAERLVLVEAVAHGDAHPAAGPRDLPALGREAQVALGVGQRRRVTVHGRDHLDPSVGDVRGQELAAPAGPEPAGADLDHPVRSRTSS
jgi:hypothetical protein